MLAATYMYEYRKRVILPSLYYVSNGVKQRGTISQVLINVYIGDFNISLTNMSINGYIGKTIIGHLCYADDFC